MATNQLSHISTAEELEALCSNAVAEGLQIEFKLKEDSASPSLSRTDKKNIAEAVSSFANSDGGTVVFGIRTERRGGLDVATALLPISDVQQFESNFRMVCALNISPSLADVNVRTIRDTDADNSGFLVCEVSRSDSRPHMSTAPGVHSYFRRSFEGSVPMTPSEVRDQILAVRDSLLSPIISYPAGGMFSAGRHWISASISIVFSLKNVGRALCRNPFLRVKASCELTSRTATYDGALEAWKTTFPYGTLIHVDDQQTCSALAFNGCVYADLLESLFAKNDCDLTDSVLIFPGSTSYVVETISDKTSLPEINFYLRFGAENAPVTEQTIAFSRKELAIGVLSQPTVRDMYMRNYGVWRNDLIESFKAT